MKHFSSLSGLLPTPKAEPVPTFERSRSGRFTRSFRTFKVLFVLCSMLSMASTAALVRHFYVFRCSSDLNGTTIGGFVMTKSECSSLSENAAASQELARQEFYNTNADLFSDK